MADKYLGVEDNVETTVGTGGITAIATTLPYVDAGTFNGIELPFYVTVSDAIDDSNLEVMLVTSVDDGLKELTVERGAEGTTGVSHVAGEAVALRVMAKHIADVSDNAVMALHGAVYVDTPTENASGQITQVDVYKTSLKTTLVARTTYTYGTTAAKLPLQAVRKIYREDGTVRRTETTDFTVVDDEITVVDRSIVKS